MLKKEEKKQMYSVTKKSKISRILPVFVLLLCILSVLSSCGSQEKMGTGASVYLETRDITGHDIKYVEMCVEDYGKMVILLDATTAPMTVANFLRLVNEGFYDGLTFHKVSKNLAIQGGDPNADGTGEIASIFVKGEFFWNGWDNDIEHKYGVISMARFSDYDSASCQFFICNGDDATHLDGEYAAFGYVVEGMSVVDEITERASKYANSDNDGVIDDKSKQPVIKYIKEISSWNP